MLAHTVALFQENYATRTIGIRLRLDGAVYRMVLFINMIGCRNYREFLITSNYENKSDLCEIFHLASKVPKREYTFLNPFSTLLLNTCHALLLR